MTTVWNKAAAKKEAFSETGSKKLLPLVSIQEGFDNEDTVDNIKDLGQPEEASTIEIKNPTKPEPEPESKEDKLDNDISLLKTTLISLVSVFLTLHVAFTWYFNLTQCSNEATFYKMFDFLLPFKLITGYFYDSIRFIDVAINEKFKGLVFKGKKEGEEREGEKREGEGGGRKLFILLLAISGLIVAYLFKFIQAVFVQITEKKFNMKKLGPYSGLVLLYFGCVIYGLYNSYKEPFAVTSPILTIIGTVILAAILFVPTTVATMVVFFIYVTYYSLVGSVASPESLYTKIADGSFLGHYRALHSIINKNHVVYEMQDDAPIKNFVESALRGFFKYLPFIVLLSGLVPLLVKSFQFNMAYLKYPFIGFISIAIAGTLWLMLHESPNLLVLYNRL